MIKRIIICLCLPLIAWNCAREGNNTGTNQAESLPENPIIEWGSGGGFTGEVTTYQIDRDGGIYKLKTRGNELLGIATNEKLTKIQSSLSALPSKVWTIDAPGNTYKFIQIKKGDLVQKVTWGDNNKDVPEGLNSTYNQLNELIKR